MIRLLQLLFFGHVHTYKIIKEQPLLIISDNNETLAKGTKYHLQCEKCGDLKFKDSL